MAKKVSERKSKRRSTVKQIAKPTQDLTKEQAKKVKGGDGASSLQQWLLISKQQPLR